MDSLFANPKVFLLATLSGVLPAILWLWFWIHQEDSEKSEPRGLIFLSFLIGAITVLVAISLEKFSAGLIHNHSLQILTWASIEEILKLLAVCIVIFSTNEVERPIDYPMYFIAVALGFAALENVLFLIKPLSVEGTTIVGLITGNLRFLGSTLLHSIASGMIGSAIGLALWRSPFTKKIYLFMGLIAAISLHTVFNFFIIEGAGANFIQVFGFLWIVAIINILIFEKLKRMGRTEEVRPMH